MRTDLYGHDRAGLVPTVAALFVETGGCYYGLPGVDPWDEARDARNYRGPHPVVCHSPCQRWSKYWHGSPRASRCSPSPTQPPSWGAARKRLQV